MDETDIARWFAAIFKGEWAELPPQESTPTLVLADSKEWATLLLSDSFNPYKAAERFKQRMFLGLGTSPDKLITFFEHKRNHVQITIYETLQDFVVTREMTNGIKLMIENRQDALLKIQADFLPILSPVARKIVEEVINASLKTVAPAQLGEASPMLLSPSEVPINAIRNWFDRVNLFRFDDKLYIHFYKTYPGMAAFIFKPGLDWFSQELRTRLGINR